MRDWRAGVGFTRVFVQLRWDYHSTLVCHILLVFPSVNVLCHVHNHNTSSVNAFFASIF